MQRKYRKRRFTIPRDQIEWYPTVDPEKCNGCCVCYEFCPKDCFSMTSNGKKVQVTAPYECVVLCSGCVKKCRQGAISFPKREDFEQYVIYED
jgi:NAD-dependent dihydropyrimidine dehydrogenase PreA subunit